MNQLFQKMARITGKVGRVAKNGRNDHHGYDYVTEGDLVEAVRGLLAEEGVAFFFSVEGANARDIVTSVFDRDTKTYTDVHAKAGPITDVVIKATFADGESGETFSVYGAGSGQDAGDKGIYKALTGAQKYLLMKTFLIATGDDPEGDTKVDAANAQERAPAPAQAPTPRPAKPHQPAVKVDGQEATASEDPMQRPIPKGKYQGRTVGSMSQSEAEDLLGTLPKGSAWHRLVTTRVETLKAMASMPEALREAVDDLDLEFDRKLADREA